VWAVEVSKTRTRNQERNIERGKYGQTEKRKQRNEKKRKTEKRKTEISICCPTSTKIRPSTTCRWCDDVDGWLVIGCWLLADGWMYWLPCWLAGYWLNIWSSSSSLPIIIIIMTVYAHACHRELIAA
jgi:hypothetical protein